MAKATESFNFQEIFDTANSSGYKKQEHLTETLVDAKIDDLNTFLSSHPVEDEILHLTAKDLEKTKYKFLASSVMRKNNPNATLYDLICASINGDSKLIRSYFSVDSGGNLKGFVAIIVGGNEVLGIKMFSFNADKNNPTLAGDLEKLLPELLKKYKVVKWDASKYNPANKRYKEFTDKYGGEVKPYTEKDEDTGLEEEMIQYVIESKEDTE